MGRNAVCPIHLGCAGLIRRARLLGAVESFVRVDVSVPASVPLSSSVLAIWLSGSAISITGLGFCGVLHFVVEINGKG